MRHWKEWLDGINQVVSRVTLNAGIPCVHEAFYFDMVYLGKNVLMGSGWYD